MDAPRFDETHAEIAAECRAILHEVAGLRKQVAATGTKKSQAKEEYAAALDAGDEKGMKTALANIRDANSAKEDAEARLTGPEIRERIRQLFAKQKSLSGAIQAADEAAAAAVNEAEAKRQAAANCRTRWHGLLTEIGAAEQALDSAQAG